MRVVDASRNGVRIRGVKDVPPGNPVAVRMERELLLGELVWCADGEAGVALEQILDLAQVERLRGLEGSGRP